MVDEPSPEALETNNTTTAKRAYAEMLEPLERASGRRLGNPQRKDCFAAFEKFPDNVQREAANALVDATSNPLGLFVYRIRNGWHELDPLPAEPVESERDEAWDDFNVEMLTALELADTADETLDVVEVVVPHGNHDRGVQGSRKSLPSDEPGRVEDKRPRALTDCMDCGEVRPCVFDGRRVLCDQCREAA